MSHWRVAVLAISIAWLFGGCAEVPRESDGGAASTERASLPPSDSARVPSRVIVLSIAGLRPWHYGSSPEGLTRRSDLWMPSLHELAAAGAFADGVTPVVPAAVYPTHATLVTGVGPVQHGVLGEQILGERGLTPRGAQLARRIKAPPLWRAARAGGLAVAALGWPSTLGADIDLLLPDMIPPPTGATWFSLLRAPTTPWLYDRLPRLAPGIAEQPWPVAAERDRLLRRLACEIAAEAVKPALWLLRFEQSGDALARFGPGSEGARAAFRKSDAELAELLSCLQRSGLLETSTLIVVGDRAFFPVHSLVHPNGVLAGAGLLTPTSSQLVSGIAAWSAFARSSGGAAVVRADSEASAVLARRALEAEGEASGAFRVVSAAELSEFEVDPQAWFGLAATPGYGLANSARVRGVVASEALGMSGYLPTQPGSAVGFVAWGAGIRNGARVPRMVQTDVAPTVARLLGVGLPRAEGRPLIGILGITPPIGRSIR